MSRRSALLSALGAVVVAAGVASPLSAQEAHRGEWLQGTALSVFAGAASAESETNVAAGAAVGWELTPRLTVEGSGLWADGPNRATSFAATLGARVNLIPRRVFVPFVSGGLGLYRAERSVTGLQALPTARTSTDFAVAVGGGADIFLRPHIAVRPEWRVLLVRAGSDVETVSVIGIHLAYHFESHVVTPMRARAR